MRESFPFLTDCQLTLQNLPPAPAVVGGRYMGFDQRGRSRAEYPARRGGRGIAAAGRTYVVRVVDLDQRRLLRIVGIDDAAIVVVMITAQQRIQRIDAAQRSMGSNSHGTRLR